MKVLGTTVNENFGDVDETAIMVTVNDIYPNKVSRHIETYVEQKSEANYAVAV